jgi:hypothetical protein
VLPCFFIALITHLKERGLIYFDLMEFLWTFSIYLESIAILPQLLVLRKYGLVENLTGKFVLCLGIYRFLYVINWLYRAHTESFYRHHHVKLACGVIQTLLYADFFYQYCRAFCRRTNRNDEEQRDDVEVDEEENQGLIFEFARTDRKIEGPSAMERLVDTSEMEGSGAV